jgi:hypothetical protein
MSKKLINETTEAILAADDLATHPVEVTNAIVDGIEDDPVGVAANALDIVDTFLNAVKLAGKKAPGLGGPATTLSLISNKEQAEDELSRDGKISDATYMSIAGDIVGIGSMILGAGAVVAGTPVVLTVAAVAATVAAAGISVAALTQSPNDTEIHDFYTSRGTLLSIYLLTHSSPVLLFPHATLAKT